MMGQLARPEEQNATAVGAFIRRLSEAVHTVFVHGKDTDMLGYNDHRHIPNWGNLEIKYLWASAATMSRVTTEVNAEV